MLHDTIRREVYLLRFSWAVQDRRSVAHDRTKHGAMERQRVSVGCARAVKRRATASAVAAR